MEFSCMEKELQYGNVKVKVIDKNPEQRKKKLTDAVNKFITKVNKVK